MAGSNSTKSGLDAVSDLVGKSTTENFELLGNETRLAILLTLWAAKSPGPASSEISKPSVPFSELRDRVGVRDSGRFNYHLDKLIGTFVESTEAGYRLTTAAEQVLGAVLAGTFGEHSSFEGEPIESGCGICGASVVIDYHERILLERCINCQGGWQESGDPSGTLSKRYVPPVGLDNRTPQEFHRKGNTWTRHRLMSMMEGVCPRCSGTVTTHIEVCESHDVADGTICESCGSKFELQLLFVCDVCKFRARVPAHTPMFTHIAVKAFYFERGLNYDTLHDTSEGEKIAETIKQTSVRSRDPYELVVTSEIDGDQLEVILDEDAHVVEVKTDD